MLSTMSELRSAEPPLGRMTMTASATFASSAQIPSFIVASEVMRKFMGMVERVARHSGTVLIFGETGTGKERIAHTIHEHSLRCSKPFVDINCAALPENLVESELFGYEKGAFSGADTAKPGLFELAHTGTIFLDEIGELDLKIQVKLLRVLDRAPYYRLGGHRKITADVRVVAASNRNLKDEVAAGRFRKDLYHRLSQFELFVPPLRERPEDVIALAEHFLAEAGEGLKFSPEALRLLETHSWPGNVRELRNIVNKVMVLTAGPQITAADVRRELTFEKAEHNFVAAANLPSDIRLDGLEAQAIEKALENTGGHRGKAAVQLGISRRTLSRKLRQYKFASSPGTAPTSLGILSKTEQLDYRAEISVLASIRNTDGEEMKCTITNISARGMGLEGLEKSLDSQSELSIRFRLPDSENTLEAGARLAWAGTKGRAGINFTGLKPGVEGEVTRWLQSKMVEEGWTIQADTPDIAAPVPEPI